MHTVMKITIYCKCLSNKLLLGDMGIVELSENAVDV